MVLTGSDLGFYDFILKSNFLTQMFLLHLFFILTVTQQRVYRAQLEAGNV